MKIQRIYIDTSVIGGCFDVEFTEWSNGLVADFRTGIFHPLLSEVIAAEIADAPEMCKAFMLSWCHLMQKF